jgi:hypothetical protein
MLRVAGLKEVAGRGVWVAREGRERRRTLRERGCGVEEEDWLLGWAILVGFSPGEVEVVLSFCFFLVFRSRRGSLWYPPNPGWLVKFDSEWLN